MEVPLQLGGEPGKLPVEEGFNPCFNGSSSSTYLSATGIRLGTVVSILVLMEVPLQHNFKFRSESH